MTTTTSTSRPATVTPSSVAGTGPSLASAARGERLKATSLRSTWWTSAAAVVAAVGLPAAIMLQGDDLAASDLAVGSSLGLVIAMAMAAVLATSDLQHGTTLLTRWADPHRGRIFAAKVLVVGIGGGLLGLAVGVLTLAVGMLTGTVPTVDAEVLQATLGQSPLYALGTALAVAVGSMLRRSALAVAGIIIWIQLVETLAPSLPQIGEYLRAWLPFRCGFMFTQPGNFGTPPHSPAVGLAYYAAVCLTVVVIGGVVTARRDS